jgi:hypothetical protein
MGKIRKIAFMGARSFLNKQHIRKERSENDRKNG